jgi:predicted house-cleaning noncanonical NTP pyrophosphatase (MazG superfamily)
MESYNKLVRDRIPEILDEKGISYERRIASLVEYKIELIKKLLEEVKEFMEAGDIEELADVLEVVCAIKQLPEYNEVENVRQKKKEEKGGFEQRIILKGRKD